jgi:hypothetical protein
LCQPRLGLWSPQLPPPGRNDRNDRADHSVEMTA